MVNKSFGPELSEMMWDVEFLVNLVVIKCSQHIIRLDIP